MLELIRGQMTDLPILYSFRRCPYAMRARMAVLVSGVAVELREIVLRAKPAEMLAASPKGTVPILVLVDGTVIDESIDIMRWSLAQNDPFDWLSRSDDQLIEGNDGPFKAALDRYKYPHRYGLVDGLKGRENAMEWLALLEERLSRTYWLCGGQNGLADIALFPFLRQFAATDPDWFASQPFPALQNWLSLLTGDPIFASIMRKYPAWTPGDPPLLFHQDQLFGH